MNVFLLFLLLVIVCGGGLWLYTRWRAHEAKLRQWRLIRTHAVLEFEDALYHVELAHLHQEIDETAYRSAKEQLENNLRGFLKQTAHP